MTAASALAAIPDSELAASATALLTETSPPALVNHCLRTYQFGAALGARDGLDPDLEMLYVASALHDLGLTERFDGPEPFEAQSAQAAYAFLVAAGCPTERAQYVGEAIAFHLAVTTAHDPRPEVALLSIGAAVDVLGLRLEAVPGDLVDAVLAEYPRLGFKELMASLMRDQSERKPDSLAGTYVRQYAFLDLIAKAPFPD
jgi:hypothetical protein